MGCGRSARRRQSATVLRRKERSATAVRDRGTRQVAAARAVVAAALQVESISREWQRAELCGGRLQISAHRAGIRCNADARSDEVYESSLAVALKSVAANATSISRAILFAAALRTKKATLPSILGLRVQPKILQRSVVSGRRSSALPCAVGSAVRSFA